MENAEDTIFSWGSGFGFGVQGSGFGRGIGETEKRGNGDGATRGCATTMKGERE